MSFSQTRQLVSTNLRKLLAFSLLLIGSPLRADLPAGLADEPCRILFESYADENWDLHSIRPDGSDRQNLTQTADVHELYPQASPDGSQICFLVDAQNAGKTERTLWLMDSDGKNRRQIAAAARHAAWSPDGSRIAFAKQEFSRFQVADYVTKRLYFYDLTTGETAVHPNEKIEHIYVPSWTADGKWIVTTVHGGMGFGHAIIALEVEGDRVVDLGAGGCRPCVSADGKRLTWSLDDHTINVAELVMSDDGPKIVSADALYHHATQHLYHPDFSPDGKFVTFSMGPGGRMPSAGPGTQVAVAEMVGVKGPWDVYVKAVGSTAEPTRLTHDPNLSNKESEWIRIQ